jgi:hypothetical protein
MTKLLANILQGVITKLIHDNRIPHVLLMWICRTMPPRTSDLHTAVERIRAQLAKPWSMEIIVTMTWCIYMEEQERMDI